MDKEKQRKKMIDIIVNAKKADHETGSFTEFLADFILGYGVIIPDDNYDTKRLRELVNADREGRCVVLPCKEGDKLKKDGFEFEADHWNIILTSFAKDDSVKTGERLRLFGVKEAEQALERMKKNG